MDYRFIVFLKNKTSLKFEYKSDVLTVVSTSAGYHITFNSGKSYYYGADKVQYYPLVSRRENVRIYEHGKLNNRYNAVDDYGRYLIFREKDSCSVPVEKNANIEICDIKKNIDRAVSVINYFKDILKESGGASFDIRSEETANETPDRGRHCLTTLVGSILLFELQKKH